MLVYVLLNHCLQVTIRDINDNAPTFDTAENVGIPDTAVVGDVVAYIRVSFHILIYAR